MRLFSSIHAHSITDTYKTEEFLIGLFGCESERHTSENIEGLNGILVDMGLCGYARRSRFYKAKHEVCNIGSERFLFVRASVCNIGSET